MQQMRFCIHYYYNPIAGGIQSMLSILHEKNSIFCSEGWTFCEQVSVFSAIITPRENAGFAERPLRCESIVEIFIRNNQASKGKSGKDMKKQPPAKNEYVKLFELTFWRWASWRRIRLVDEQNWLMWRTHHQKLSIHLFSSFEVWQHQCWRASSFHTASRHRYMLYLRTIFRCESDRSHKLFASLPTNRKNWLGQFA